MTRETSSESETPGLNFRETELTLGLPGGSSSPSAADIAGKCSSGKRGLSETVDLSLGSTLIETRGRGSDDPSHPQSSTASSVEKPRAAKAQVVGWPPVKLSRKKSTLVKVAVEQAPYLRKVDLGMYSSYHQLLIALENMFTIRHLPNESKLVDPVNGTEYLVTYDDKEGDWMLVGDVPWKMFVESCKRLRLMKKSSEAMGLAPTRPEKSTNST